jgi:hypothetical protein
MAFLAQHAELRRKYGPNGLAVVKEKFCVESTVASLVDLFRRYYRLSFLKLGQHDKSRARNFEF